MNSHPTLARKSGSKSALGTLRNWHYLKDKDGSSVGDLSVLRSSLARELMGVQLWNWDWGPLSPWGPTGHVCAVMGRVPHAVTHVPACSGRHLGESPQTPFITCTAWAVMVSAWQGFCRGRN